VTIYVVDTSAWINAWRLYPPDLFRRIWSNIGDLVAHGSVRAPDEVLIELKRGTDTLVEHLSQWPDLAYPLDAALQGSVREVLSRYQLQDPDSDRSRADPFVVALALSLKGVVVSNEKASRPGSARPRIPDACAGLGLRCIPWLGFLREQSWDL
jgi:hypothetical protein